MDSQLDRFFQQVDSLSEEFVERLRQAVAIPSVSCEDEHRPDLVKMAQFLVDRLTELGAHVESRPLGRQEGKEHLELPPVVVARYGEDASKRTILVYGHYDVQPALREDGWNTDPWTMAVAADGRLYGRGTTDDKGPVLAWLHAIRAHQAAKIDFPVNLLMCFEGMEEYGSDGLDAFVEKEAKAGGFFASADAVCISDNYWLGTEKPCLTYGLRGCSYYSMAVSGPGHDLHSGVFGGTAQEPMTDLVRLLGTLVDTDGRIQIAGLNDMVAPIGDEERALYQDISYTMANLHESIGSQTTMHDDKEQTLMARWRNPTLSIHGIEGAFSAPGSKTVIPAKVVGKFSIRTVPDMEPDAVDAAVLRHCHAAFARLGSKNTLDVSLQHAARWWVVNPKHWNFGAAAKAAERVYGVKPDLTREGGSIPVTLTFEQAMGKNVLLLPMGNSTDGAHSINEKLDRRNYIDGTKMLGAYLHYVAADARGGA